MTIFRFFLLISFPLLVHAKSEKALRFDVTKYQLPNGLTVLLHQDRSVPIVSYHTWFKVGSKDEEVNYTGIAHLFEHMMFKGTKKYSNKEYDKILKEMGAVNNAFTFFDYTGYYTNFPSEHLEKVMDLESDRFSNLIIDEQNLNSEREVVKEERRYRVENNVIGLMLESIYGLVYKHHPYRWPIIGYMKDLENIDVKKAREFYRQFYAPNNAVLVIAGHFDFSRVKKLIDKYYGKIPSQEIRRTQIQDELPQKEFRTSTFFKDIQNDYLSLSFRIPGLTDKRSPAYDILAQVLGGGRSSRLHKKLVIENALATDAIVFTTSTKDHSILNLIAILKPEPNFQKANNKLKTVEEIIFSELKNISNVSQNELEKVKNSIVKSHVDGLKTIDGKAQALAMNEIVMGSYEALFDDLDNYLAVELKDIQVLSKEFSKQNANRVMARPKAFNKGSL